MPSIHTQSYHKAKNISRRLWLGLHNFKVLEITQRIEIFFLYGFDGVEPHSSRMDSMALSRMDR
jgi:hypothetical protein